MKRQKQSNNSKPNKRLETRQWEYRICLLGYQPVRCCTSVFAGVGAAPPQAARYRRATGRPQGGLVASDRLSALQPATERALSPALTRLTGTTGLSALASARLLRPGATVGGHEPKYQLAGAPAASGLQKKIPCGTFAGGPVAVFVPLRAVRPQSGWPHLVVHYWTGCSQALTERESRSLSAHFVSVHVSCSLTTGSLALLSGSPKQPVPNTSPRQPLFVCLGSSF